jgi:branched-chain amino acid transport system substrate-binding protein
MKKQGFVIVLTLFLAFTLSSCTKEPIKIGFIADLSVKSSQLGIDARNALQLEIEQLNKLGGINGHQIELIVKDEQGDMNIAHTRFDEFEKEGIKIVIGPLTSSMAQPALDHQSESLLVLSPSISSDLPTGLDDYFIRTSQVNINQGKTLSEFIAKNGKSPTFGIYSLVNQEYTKSLMDAFKDSYESFGGEVVATAVYDASLISIEEMTSQVKKSGANNIILMLPPTDTAKIQQGLSKELSNFQSYSIPWSMTKDLIENGGRVVEGMLFVGNYGTKVYSDEYLQFTEDFLTTYGYTPSFICYWTYDAFDVLKQALVKAGNTSPVDIKTTITEIHNFTGITESYSIDEFGDASKTFMMYELKNGEFVPLE